MTHTTSKEVLRDYYFTFGQNHRQNNGMPMKDFWIRVKAVNYGEARAKFIDQFTTIFMPSKDAWAFQYPASKFESEYFPEGEYLLIN